MTRGIFSLILMGALMAFTACGDKEGSEGAGQIALTPNNAECLRYGPNHGNCNPSYFNNLGNGFSAYQTYNQGGSNFYVGQENNFRDGYCGCPNGQPLYHPQYGLGCMPAYQGQSCQYWNYNYSNYSMSQANMNINYEPYYSSYNNGGNRCYKAIAYHCRTDQPNTCGAGGTCQAIAGQSYEGVCTYNTAQGGQNQNPWGY